MITLCIPEERIDALFLKSGYRVHKNGSMAGGYIYELERGRYSIHPMRFHANYEKFTVTIHIDKTIHGYHTVKGYYSLEKKEKFRILDIYHKMFPPNEDRLRMKVISKGEFAPNLRELQRSHKTALQSDIVIPISPLDNFQQADKIDT